MSIRFFVRPDLRVPLLIGLATLILAGLSASASAAPTERSRTNATTLVYIKGSVVPDVAQAPNYVPEALGWWNAAGLNVESRAVNGAVAAISALQAGQGDIATALADNIPAAVLKGATLISIAQYSYSPSFSMVFPASSKYQTLAGLKGATIGVQNFASASYPLARAVLTQNGIHPDNDARIVGIGQTAQAAQAVAAGRVDAAVFTTSQLSFLDEAGVKYKYIRFPGLSRNYVGQELAVSKEALANPEKRKAIVTWARLFFTVHKLSMHNRAKLLEVYQDATKDTTPLATMQASLAYNEYDRLLPRQAYGRYGYSNGKFWSSLLKLQLDTNLIPSAPPLNQLFTQELVKEYNQGTCGPFDSVRVVADSAIPKTESAELWVGQDQGFFGQESVRLSVSQASSAATISRVAAGQADLGLIRVNALGAAGKGGLVSVYQGTHGPTGTVFVTRKQNLTNNAKKGAIIRTFQGYTFARQFTVDQPAQAAASYKKSSKETASSAAIVKAFNARNLGAKRILAGWHSASGAVSNALISPINKQQCFWYPGRPIN